MKCPYLRGVPSSETLKSRSFALKFSFKSPGGLIFFKHFKGGGGGA